MAWPMMEWVLESHYQPLFRQQAMLEQAILVFDAGESRLIDLMNSIVSQHPEVKLFSLPKLDARRSVELGVKGKPDAVAQAMLAIKTGVDAAGFNWQTVN